MSGPSTSKALSDPYLLRGKFNMANQQQKTCFVVMGFGIKTDYHNSRDLDLDKSYKYIIKKAVEDAGLKCIRADEIPHAGTIDVPMFEQLLKADVVLADLSTSNCNAIYELGVRHALRPRTTIIIAEEQFSNPFDVNHILIRRYRHDGKVLDIEEVDRFREVLKQAIIDIVDAQQNDSPVYTYLSNLVPPSEHMDTTVKASDTVSAAAVSASTQEAGNPTVSVLLQQVTEAKKNSDFLLAKGLLTTLHNISPRQSQWVQQLALVTYKAKYPDARTALLEAKEILQTLQPMSSNNAETLGIWGGIHKRLFDINQDRADLDTAISSYEKGYRLQNDHFNGINWAFLLNVRASLAQDRAEAITDFMLARRTREDVLKIADAKLAELNAIKDVEEDEDARYWVLATKAEAWIGLGNDDEAEKCLQQAKPYSEYWMCESTQQQIDSLRQLLQHSPLDGL
jgi:tetratricopeptide (TPR) repeat protein